MCVNKPEARMAYSNEYTNLETDGIQPSPGAMKNKVAP